MKKIITPIITLALILGVGYAIFDSATSQMNMTAQEAVVGLSGSEKIPFFKDERVIEALQDEPNFLIADVEKAGSRQIATSFDLNQYDFAFPAGMPAAEKIRQQTSAKSSFQPFFTPMVIASFKPVVDVLQANGIVEKKGDIHYIVNMNKLLTLIVERKRWTDLASHESYPANKSILVTTTDVRKSNSAGMFLALASYVLNGQEVVQSKAEADNLVEELASIFLRQGFAESSSAQPFNNFLRMGPGKTAMVMIYESQFLHELAKPDSAITDDMVLLYPEPTLYTKHVLIPFTEKGRKLGEALKTSEKLQQLAAEHGLRGNNPKVFNQFFKEKGVEIPEYLVNVIEPPSYEIMEGMIRSIEHKYAQN